MTSTPPITVQNRPDTLLHQATWLCENRADQTAVVFVQHGDEKRITFAEFFQNAARYADALHNAGIKAGDLVALVLQHDEAVLYGFWGAMLIGAIPSVFPFLTEKLDRERYFDSLRKLIDHADVRVVITYDALRPELENHLSGIDGLAVILNKDDLNVDPVGNPAKHLSNLNISTDATAFLQHSSGSTGLQKGVMLSHRAVINQVASYSAAIKLTSDDKIASWLPLYHDMGLIAGFIMPILQGIPLILMSPFEWVRDPKTLLWAVHHHHATLCWLPNFAYNFLATRIRDDDLGGLDLASLRALINCSEPVYAESHTLFEARFTPYGLQPNTLTTCYAMAENTFAVTQSSIGETARIDVVDRKRLMDDRLAVPSDDEHGTQTLVSCGSPIANCAIKVIDEDNTTLPERQVGEIALKSDSMLTGYYRSPDITAQSMRDGWYLTGDMGYIADGELYITGRKKDLIIVGGKNVYPQDIENLLNDVKGLHPGRATAFGVLNDRLGTEDIAIVAEVEREDILTDQETKSAILREIRGRVAQSTDVTARYVQLVEPKWLIKTSSGKIARRANRDKFLAEFLR